MNRSVSIAVVLVLFAAPIVIAGEYSGSVGIDMETESMEPFIWLCDHRIVYDDNLQTGRSGGPGSVLIERINNYAFEGEMVFWKVLVMDKNKNNFDVRVIASPMYPDEPNMEDWQEANCELEQPPDWHQDLEMIDLCEKNKTGNWECLPDGASGEVMYSTYGSALWLEVWLHGLKDMQEYQLTLQGRSGGDGNDELGDNCVYPDAPATDQGFVNAWACGDWGGEGFWNFDMTAETDLDGEYHAIYLLDLPEGHYGPNLVQSLGIGFTVKEFIADLPGEEYYPGVLFETEGMDFTIENSDMIGPACNVRILEEEIEDFDPLTMSYYNCRFTVETPESMFGEYWVTVEACDWDDPEEQCSTFAEKEFWYFNPNVALSINTGQTNGGGIVDFGMVTPGTSAYATTVTVGNDADPGTGVLLDMFISGTDFYDPMSSGAKCPDTNQLSLQNFKYFASSGAYSSYDDPRGLLDLQDEHYVYIGYGDAFDSSFYDRNEIIQAPEMYNGYYRGNVLSPGSEIAVTLRLDLPEPCNGNFVDGDIFFWGIPI
jgi:hypothetical protein